jgi:hypothetical protein
MSPSEDPRELRRLDEDRVRGEHEARQVCRCVGARRGACVVVRVQEPLVRHAASLRSRESQRSRTRRLPPVCLPSVWTILLASKTSLCGHPHRSTRFLATALTPLRARFASPRLGEQQAEAGEIGEFWSYPQSRVFADN